VLVGCYDFSHFRRGEVDAAPQDAAGDGTTPTCGLPSQPCCGGFTCIPGAVCTSGTCEACGEPGQLCCTRGSCASTPAVCTGAVCISKRSWAVGNDREGMGLIGSVSHWDGVAWSDTTSVQGSSNLYSIWGTSATDVWAGGDDTGGTGLLAHWTHGFGSVPDL